MLVFLKQKFMPPLLSVALVLAVIPTGMLALPQTAAAATQTVTTEADDGAGSLRQTIADASAGDTITFASDVNTVTLTSGNITFATQNLTIDGSVDHDGSDVTITSTVAATSGGLLCCNAGNNDTLTLKSLTLTGGKTTGGQFGGGALYTNGALILADCTITGNSTDMVGGGICTVGNVTMTNCTLSDNTARYDGGGIHTNATATLTDCIVSGNKASDTTYGEGGGIGAGNAVLTGCTVSGNTAEDTGGGIYTIVATLTNCNILNNTATRSSGGGMYASSSATLTNCTVSGNTASGSGGGMYAGSSATLTNCTVSGNTAGNDGGGVDVSISTASFLTLTCCTISGNYAWGSYDTQTSTYLPGGGGVCCSNPVTLRGSVVAGNYFATGSLYTPTCSEDEIDILTGSTCVPYNGGGSGSSGLLQSSGDGTYVAASSASYIVGVPDPTDTSSLDQLMATTTDTNSQTVGKLADNGGGMQTIMPMTGQMSRADASQYAGWGVTDDQLGVARPSTGNGTVGAVEANFDTSSTVVTIGSDSPVAGETTLRQALAYVKDGGTVTFDPGVTEVTLTSGEIAFNQKNVTIDGGSGITVRRATSSTGRLLDSSATSGALTLKGLTLSGGKTASNDNGGAVLAAGALDLADCTLANNTTGYMGSGGGLYAPTATLTNCTVSDNTGDDSGGGIYATDSTTLTDCVLSGNDAARSSGGGVYAANSATLTGCTVTGNTASGSGAGVLATTATLTNCTVAGNIAQGAGGGVSTPLDGDGNSVTLTCCTVSGNYAYHNGDGGGVYCTNPVTLKGTVVAGNYNIESGSEDEISIYRVLYNGGTGGSGLFTGSGDGTHTTTGSAAFIIGVPVSTDMASLNQLMATTDSNGNWVGKLADNGGSMQTIMPVAGQMDKVNASLFTTWGVTTDQIGATRPGSGYGTVGAVELHKSTVVTSSGDTPVSGLTTLRQALANVSDGGTVTFAPEVTTVTLTGSEIAFSQQDVTIDGLTNHSGSGVTVTRDITTTGGLLNSTATSGVLTLKSLTLTGGTSEDFGGALYCAGDASLISCTTSNNSAVRGGGLYVVGTATLEGCAISDNTADFGGGLYVVGSALLTACTLSGNAATGSNGGGICADGSVTLTNCTVSGNTAYNPGGGICANGSVTLTNCTVSGNSVSRSFTSGGGIFAGSVKLLGSVVAGNYNDGIASEITTGNTSYSGDGTLQIAGGADGTTASSAYYVVGAPAGGLDTLMQTTTVTLGSANCKVGLLAGNGGETQTIMPVAGSVLLDAIPASQTWLPTVDQRGKDRPAVAGGPATIGAVEPTCALAPVITTQPSGLSLVYGQSASALSVVVATPADGGQLSYQWYSSATSSLTSPTQISGATSSAYTPATTAVATTYYYCVITNTTTDLDINMAQTTSDAAEVIVDKASQSISLEGLGSTYTYGASSFTVSVTGGLGTGNVTYASSDTSVASVVNNANNTATITILKAGQFSITADKVADSAYNAATVTSGMVTVDEAMPTVTLTSADVSAGSDVVLNVTVASSAGAIPTGTVTFYEGTTMLAQNVSLVNGQASYTVTTPDAGNHDYTVDYSGLTGYYRPASSDTCTVGVNKIDQSTLTFVDPGTKVYGEGDFTLSTTGGSGTGAVSFKVPDDSVISISGNTATIHGAGTVVITATKAGDNIYNDAQATFTLTVNPRDISNVTVKVTGPAVYTGSQLQPNFSVSDGTIAIGAGDYYAGAYGANVNVVDGGSFVVYGQGNYTGQKLVNFNIAPKPIAVTADNQQKCFEDGDPTLSWTAPGLVKGDHPTGALTYTGWAIGHYDITQGSLNFGPNYTVAFTKGTMTITNTPAMDKAISAIDHLAKPIRSKADADAVAEATRDYGALSADEKGQIAASVKSKLKTAQGQAATVNHTDGEFTATGASLLWNIRLVVTPVAKSDSRYAAFARKVSGKKIAALYDIKLIDTLTGKTYEPPHGQTITVTLSNAALAAIKGASIAHEKTGGAIEYLPATRKGNKLSFTATSFSLYGVVSNKGSGSGSGALDLSGLSTGDRSNQVLFTAVLLILAAALAIVALDPRRRKAASEVAAAAAAAAASEDASEDASATASESATGSSSSD